LRLQHHTNRPPLPLPHDIARQNQAAAVVVPALDVAAVVEPVGDVESFAAKPYEVSRCRLGDWCIRLPGLGITRSLV